MKQIKVFVAANAVVAMAFAGFFGQYLCLPSPARHRFAKAVNASVTACMTAFAFKIHIKHKT
jgi:hypothetical protein